MAFEFQRSHDLELIRSLVTSDRWAWAAMTDDTCPRREDFRIPADSSRWFVLVREGENLVGVWSLHPESETSAGMHCCLKRSVWGGKARQIAEEWLDWAWANTPFTRLTAVIPAIHFTALALAKRVGMREFNTMRGVYRKHGRMHDLVELEITPGAGLCPAMPLLRQPIACHI